MTRESKLHLLMAVAVAAALLLLFGWLASEVYEGETLAFDNAVRGWIHGFASPAATEFFRGATFMGSTVMVVGLSIAAIAVYLYLKDRGAAMVIATIMVGELILNNVLKDHYARTRPQPYFEYPLPSSYSFPSGHSFASFCLYITLAWLISRRVPTPAAIAVWMAAVAIALFVGLSRIYLGVHYPTDVLGGYLAALIWSSIVLYAYHKHRQRSHA